MLNEVCLECRNYFYTHDSMGRVIADSGNFTITGDSKSISVTKASVYQDFLTHIKPLINTIETTSIVGMNYLTGQYVRIIGSVLNDGVYKITNASGFPDWVQPTGTHDAYNKEDIVVHNGRPWISLIDANTQVPGADLAARYWFPINFEDIPPELATGIIVDGEPMQNESFNGFIIPLIIPNDFIKLVNQISEFQSRAAANPNFGMIQSETFGGYSYVMASSGTKGLPVTWKESFSSRLNNYRKMLEEKI